MMNRPFKSFYLLDTREDRCDIRRFKNINFNKRVIETDLN